MSFIGRDGLLRKVAGLQALVRNDGGHQDLAQRAPVHAYLPPDRLRGLAGARGVVPAPADEPLVASYSVGLEQPRISPGMRHARSGGMISNESRRKADT